jgi:hypothetical protein
MAINFDKVPRYVRQEVDPPRRMVTRGAKNSTVKRIQEWLNFHDCRTGIDSDFGPATQACVRDFQALAQLPVTGKVNKATWEALVEPMRNALVASTPVVSRPPADAVRHFAEEHVTRRPVEIGGPNEGPWVRLYCEGNDGLPWAWCAGFVTLIMQQAYFYLGRRAPIKGSVSCDSIAAQAKAAGCFVSGRAVARGDVRWDDLGGCCIFLKRRTATDWVHAGFALEASGPASALVFTTIEGNTNDEGSREGYEACRRTRGLGSHNYDFVTFA